MNTSLLQRFGAIDIYLFDQLLKGRFDGCQKVLDAGCGGGRNLVYFLQNGFDVYGNDQNELAIEEVRILSKRLAPHLPTTNFQVASVEAMLFPDTTFDMVICSAVLHFARDKAHFDTMVRSLWRVLAPGGFLFTRLASTIGLENRIVPLGHGRYFLPDGSERYLVDQQTLLNYTQELGGELFEPIKTTNVQDLRCMTTWCVQKM
ncbi:class I SAM-dependent methyltransferase [Telluribacter sp.]|jgi:SAM-dependent methyltransferase|uniref:class I SAM-dependent methyltransferase n=1 Tax=Telluribacter sp. TaxID=1978767 RepID=UPI002E0DBBC5|nr:class I SAM-dependent methyltransferase [Telluribacter sp.]